MNWNSMQAKPTMLSTPSITPDSPTAPRSQPLRIPAAARRASELRTWLRQQLPARYGVSPGYWGQGTTFSEWEEVLIYDRLVPAWQEDAHYGWFRPEGVCAIVRVGSGGSQLTSDTTPTVYHLGLQGGLASWQAELRPLLQSLNASALVNNSDGGGQRVDPDRVAEAIRSGHVAALRSFLAAGWHPDQLQEGHPPALHLGCAMQQPAVVRWLLRVGANPELRDDACQSALHVAATAESLEGLELLLEAGASVLVRDARKRTPLHVAAAAGRVAAIRGLVAAGAAIAAPMAQEMTPLHLASWHGQAQAVVALAELGAALDARSLDGNTALHYAAYQGQVRVIKTLIRLGAEASLLNHAGKSYLQVVNEPYQGAWIPLLD